MTSSAAEKKSPSFDAKETYRDELNFAEFPLALLDRPSAGQKSIEFSDTIFDKGRRAPVTRKLTISASDKFGLPTPRDEEVILGLIQLSHQSQFADRKVFFSRGQLVRLLGWSEDGKSYQRVSEALSKWAGTTLFWEKSWWSKEEQCWVDEVFHILDNVTLYDRDRSSRRLEQSGSGGPAAVPLSSFVWNEVVFASFKSGYLKPLDLDFYRALDSAISKKMFRFLDKRFHKARTIEFDLRVFSFEHIGLSRNYHTGEIKRRLRPAIKELEEKGFLEPLTDSERFLRKGPAEWSVVFVKKGAPKAEQDPVVGGVIGELVRRGVGAKVAHNLADAFTEERIKEKTTLHDNVTKLPDKRSPRNPPGFLVAAIRENFEVKTWEEQGKAASPKAGSGQGAIKPALTERTPSKRDEKQNLEFAAFEAWWQGLSEEAKEKAESAALAAADKFSLASMKTGRGLEENFSTPQERASSMLTFAA